MATKSRKRASIMAKISKTQIYATHWLNHIGFTVEQISDEIGVSKKQIETTLSANTEDQITNEQQSGTNITPKHMLITHTSGKKLNTVAIMTKEASSISDEVNKKSTAHLGRDNTKNIFRPNK